MNCEQCEKLWGELERVRKEAAAMLEALIVLRMALEEAYRIVGNGTPPAVRLIFYTTDQVIAGGAGKDYIAKEKVRPIVKLLVSISQNCDCDEKAHSKDTPCFRCDAYNATLNAHKLGLLEDKQ